MTIQRRVINAFYHAPKGFFKTLFRFGLINYLLMNQGMKKMRKASEALIFSNQTPVYEIHFLTGKKFLYQTLFCIYSLEKESGQAFLTNLYDDGSFDNEIINYIKARLPNVRIHNNADIENRLKKHLPIASFPYLNHKRNVYPHIKKLIDIHCGNTGWKMVLDSDMLFFNTPDKVLDWLRLPEKPIYMLDSDYAYGFPKHEMEKLCSKKLATLINVGLIGLNSTSIKWDELEIWAKSLEETFGNSYYLEQALTAMIIGDNTCEILPKSEYIVYPQNSLNDNIKLMHFVDLSKALYFRKAWKSIF